MTKRKGSRYKRGGGISELVTLVASVQRQSTRRPLRGKKDVGFAALWKSFHAWKGETFRRSSVFETISRLFLLLLFITFLDYNEMKKSAAAVDPFWKDLAEDGFVSRRLSNGRKVGRKVENKSGDSSGWVTRSTGRALNEITRAHGARLGNWIFVQSRRVPCLETRFSSGHPANFISEPAYRLNFSPARENP